MLEQLKSGYRKYQKIVYILIFIAYVAGNVLCVLSHEHWRDEGQAWMMAKTLSFPELLGALKGEGHPILWYLLIMPFAKMGFPYRYFGFISLAVMSVASVFWLKSRIPDSVKFIVLASPLFSYFNTAFARSYCLIVLEVVLVGYYYEKRKEHPVFWGILIAAMFQTHIYMAGLALMLLLQMGLDGFAKKEKGCRTAAFIGFTGAILGVLFLILELRGERSGVLGTAVEEFLHNPFATVILLFKALNNLLEAAMYSLSANYVLAGKCLLLLVFLTTFGIAVTRIKTCWQEVLIGLGGVGAVCLINALMYQGLHVQHGLTVLLIFMMCVWLIYQKAENPLKIVRYMWGGLVGITFMFLCGETAYLMRLDLSVDYSGAEKMGQYLLENMNENAVVVVTEDSDFFPNLIAYTEDKVDFVRAIDGREYSYCDRLTDINASFDMWTEDERDTYYIYTHAVSEPELELIFEQSSFNLRGENFWLYKRKF